MKFGPKTKKLLTSSLTGCKWLLSTEYFVVVAHIAAQLRLFRVCLVPLGAFKAFFYRYVKFYKTGSLVKQTRKPTFFYLDAKKQLQNFNSNF